MVAANAAEPARTSIRDFPSIRAALESGRPLFAPPGDYDFPVGLRLVADIDLLGSVAPEKRPRFKVGASGLLPGNFSVRIQGVDFVAADKPTRLLLIDTPQPFDLPALVLLDCRFERCTPILWPLFPSVEGQVIRQLQMRRFSVAGAPRGVVAAGRVDEFELTDFEVKDCGRFGVSIGPAGKGINETIKAPMRRGLVARGTITGTVIQPGSNSGQLLVTGNHVVIEDMRLYDMVLPRGYREMPDRATQSPADSEPLYTKVDHLIVRRVHIRNDGGFQALWAIKGAGDDGGPHGSHSRGEDLVLENTGGRYAVGIWFQSSGTNVLERIKMIGRTHVAFISHDVSTGTVHIRDWVDEQQRSGKAPDLRVKGTVEVTIGNSPSLVKRETPKPRGAK